MTQVTRKHSPYKQVVLHVYLEQMPVPYTLRYIYWRTQVAPLRQISEIFWIVLSGIPLFLFYMTAAFAALTSILGIIFIPKIFQLAIHSFNPIGSEIVRNVSPTSTLHDPNSLLVKLLNILWFLCLGWEFFIIHIILAIIQMATIFGIGNAFKHLKLGVHCLFPYGKHIQPAPIPPKPTRTTVATPPQNGPPPPYQLSTTQEHISQGSGVV
jgi:uncharacterized membrane protein YccF (DUF307 family)